VERTRPRSKVQELSGEPEIVLVIFFQVEPELLHKSKRTGQHWSEQYNPSFVAINSCTRVGQKVGHELRKDSIIT